MKEGSDMRFRALRLVLLAALVMPAAPGCVFTRGAWEEVERQRVDDPDGDHAARVAFVTVLTPVLLFFDVTFLPIILVGLATGD